LEVFLGRTLMSLYPAQLREIDAEGNTILEKDGFTYAWGCHATADGYRIIVDYSGKYIIEYDPSGKEVWRRNALPGPPSDCRRLSDGRILLALSDTQSVVEIDREGEVIWSVKLDGRPTCAERLSNGNTLVNLQFGKRVVEVDREGKIVWELGGLDNALTSQALPNGNVLVCEMNLGKAVEYNREGKVVWQHEGFSNACQAQRLPSGNTLVSDNNGLHEISPAGKEVWSLQVPRGRFWRY
jgi:outer membrane protein assembly factor BamB